MWLPVARRAADTDMIGIRDEWPEAAVAQIRRPMLRNRRFPQSSRLLVAALLLPTCLTYGALAYAQAGKKETGAYPARPVRIIVPLSPGGGVDILARLVGQHYNAVWGQPFIVDNRTGAGGNIG